MMSMGQKLYEIWRASLVSQGVTGLDEWSDLHDSEQSAWEETGETVSQMIEEGS